MNGALFANIPEPVTAHAMLLTTVTRALACTEISERQVR
jgi:hypothetical protein